MSPEARGYLDFARDALDSADAILLGADRPTIAGREAYIATLNAAPAIIFERTGRAAKTHSGTRSELSRLAHLDSRIDPGFAKFLADGYEVKSWSDYAGSPSRALSRDEAREIIATSRRLVSHIENLLSPTDLPPA